MKLEDAVSAPVHFTPQSILGELPGYSLALDMEITGAEIEAIFKDSADLPGIALTRHGKLAGAISQSHFYKVVSRGFGREIYYPRPIRIIMEEMEEPTLILRSDCPIQEGVDRCLARPEGQIYEPFVVIDEESGRFCVCSFQTLLLASSQIFNLRNRQMELILHSITDGLLVIDRDYVISGEYSRAVEAILEQESLAGTPFPDVLARMLDAKTLQQTVEYLRVLFNPRLIDGLIKSINPIREIKARFRGARATEEERTKYFAVNFDRIRAQGEITQILVRIEDITRRVTLAQELAAQQEESEDKLKLLLEVFRVEPASLHRFMGEFDREVQAVSQLLATPLASVEVIHATFRKIHTLKGDAGQLRLSHYETRLHRYEDQLAEFRARPVLDATDFGRLRVGLDDLFKLSEQLHGAIEQLKKLAVAPQGLGALKSNGHSPEAAETERALPGPIQMLTVLVPELSQRMGKPVVFHAMARDQQVPGHFHELLREVLPHLARNAVAHGIESAEERRRRGKPATGVIQMAVNQHPHTWEMIFQDDGGGLDAGRLQRRAQELGLTVGSEDDARHVIFHPGFSTAEEVTEIAGRGVGLDSVRAALQEHGGEIIPHSQPGVFCAFQILLPREPKSGGRP